MKGFRKLTPAALLTCVVMIGFLPPGLWSGLEHRAYDVRLRVLREMQWGHAKPSGNVLVVGLEERLQTRDKPLLFWYPEFGHFVRLTAKYRASAVGLDFIPNQSLAAKLGTMDVGLIGGKPAPRQAADLEEVGRRADMALTEALRESGRRVPVVQGVEDGLLPFYYSAMIEWEKVTPGLLRLHPDPDFQVRRFRTAPDGGLEPFAAALFTRMSGKRSAGGDRFVNYLLVPAIPVVSLHDVLSGKVDPGIFTGKAVILCYLSKTEDTHATPLGRLPGGIIHAAALETMLTGTDFVPAPWAAVPAAVALMALLAFAAAIRLKPLAAAGAVFLITGVYAAANTALLAKGILLPLFPAILIPFISVTVYYPYRYLAEERHRKRIYRSFSYYIDPKLLDSIIARDPDNLLHGERRDICILFLDVRNFTRLSREREAEDVVAFLNIFFGRITDVIQRRDGFVNKFIGDGLMAFFMSGGNPVLNAVRSAREILSITAEINSNGEARPYLGDWEIAVGIGINYGSVILGNVGSERKMDFTVIGDPVNVASRIEGLTKKVGRPVLISSRAYEKVGDESSFQCMGTHEIDGSGERMTLYTLAT